MNFINLIFLINFFNFVQEIKDKVDQIKTIVKSLLPNETPDNNQKLRLR